MIHGKPTGTLLLVGGTDHMTQRRQIGMLLRIEGLLAHGPAGASTSATELGVATHLDQTAR